MLVRLIESQLEPSVALDEPTTDVRRFVIAPPELT